MINYVICEISGWRYTFLLDSWETTAIDDSPCFRILYARRGWSWENKPINRRCLSKCSSIWIKYLKPFNALTNKGIKNLSATELKGREAICIERKAREVAGQVTTCMVNDEPVPAKGCLNCYTTTYIQWNGQIYRIFWIMQMPKRMLLNILFLETTALRIYIYLWIVSVLSDRQQLSINRSLWKNWESGILCEFCTYHKRTMLWRQEIEEIVNNESGGYHCLPLSKTQQRAVSLIITCQGYSWKQHTHQGNAPWMIPAVSQNSQENCFWLGMRVFGIVGS